MDLPFAEYYTPCGEAYRTQAPPSARSGEYISDSDVTIMDSSEKSVILREDRLIAGRNKIQRRKIIKAKRRIFTSMNNMQICSGKFVFRGTSVQNRFRESKKNYEQDEHETMKYVEQWIVKHRDEFKKWSRIPVEDSVPIPKTPQEIQLTASLASLQPTHEMVWINAMLPAQTNGTGDHQSRYVNRMIPLLVPIGTGNLPISVVKENQQLFSSIFQQIDQSKL